jgi:hypothetical protein
VRALAPLAPISTSLKPLLFCRTFILSIHPSMFRFFDEILAISRFGFFLKHVQINIHQFNLPFNWRAFVHGI